MKRLASFTSRRHGESKARRSAGIAASVVALALVAIAAACSNQGEGERCEIANGNEDCKTDDGLICYTAVQLGGRQSDPARCCPINRSTATHPVCIIQTGTLEDAATPADTGPVTPAPDGATGTEDAGSDAADASDANDANDQ